MINAQLLFDKALMNENLHGQLLLKQPQGRKSDKLVLDLTDLCSHWSVLEPNSDLIKLGASSTQIK